MKPTNDSSKQRLLFGCVTHAWGKVSVGILVGSRADDGGCVGNVLPVPHVAGDDGFNTRIHRRI